MKTLIIIIMLVALSGCSVLWTDHVFVGTLFKNFDVSEAGMIADSNSIQIGGAIIESKNDNVKIITPYVGIQSGNDK